MGPTASMQGRIAKRGNTANLRGGSHATCVILCSKNLGGGCSAQSLRNSRNATAWVTDPPEPEQLSWEHAEKTKPQHASPSCWLGGEQVPAQPGSLKIGHREILSPLLWLPPLLRLSLLCYSRCYRAFPPAVQQLCRKIRSDKIRISRKKPSKAKDPRHPSFTTDE